MSDKFKVGDIVECVDDYGHIHSLTIGEKYRVEYVFPCSDYLILITDNNIACTYTVNRFKLAEELKHSGELDKMEEFDATRLGFYKSRDGDILRVIHVLDDKYEHEEPVIAVDEGGDSSHFPKSGKYYSNHEHDFDLIEYLGPELPVKKEPRKLEFKASMLEDTFSEFNNNYAVDSALKAECGHLMVHDYLYKDLGLFEKISKWKVTMEEILE